MFFYQIALVLALEVRAPVHRVLELDAVCHGLFKDFHGLCVGDTLEGNAQNASHALDEAVVVFVVEELEVIHAVIKGILHQVFHKFLGQFHVVLEVVEGHFGLDHPELCQVAGRVGILCTEGGAKGVDFTYSGGTQLTLQLTGYGEGGLLSKEVLAEVYVALLVQRNVLEVHGGYLEHVSCALSVGLGDEGSVQVYKAFLVKEGMDGVGHGVTDAKDGAKGIGSEAHVGYAAEILQRSVLFLKRETHGIAVSQNFHFRGLDFYSLTTSHGSHKLAFYGQRGSCGDALDEFFVKELGIGYDLDIVDGRTVIEGDEFNLFIASFCADPTLCQHFYARLRGKQSLDFGSFQSFHKSQLLLIMQI